MIERLNISKAILVVVDLQEAFAGAISDFEKIVQRAVIAVHGCAALGIPIVATEQVPAKLGKTVEPLRNALGGVHPLEKTAFSACGAPGFMEGLGNRSQILLCGIETHICVQQTALDLLAQNRRVQILIDAVGSRSPHDREAGLQKLWAAGAIPSSVEMALFELMGDSRHEQFRAIQKLVK
ncbi:MAG TPA: isochorismatase family protein [Tepidisphaeraceae bacterium]|jgi:nicotinamidase-related amidase